MVSIRVSSPVRRLILRAELESEDPVLRGRRRQVEAMLEQAGCSRNIYKDMEPTSSNAPTPSSTTGGGKNSARESKVSLGLLTESEFEQLRTSFPLEVVRHAAKHFQVTNEQLMRLEDLPESLLELAFGPQSASSKGNGSGGIENESMRSPLSGAEGDPQRTLSQDPPSLQASSIGGSISLSSSASTPKNRNDTFVFTASGKTTHPKDYYATHQFSSLGLRILQPELVLDPPTVQKRRRLKDIERRVEEEEYARMTASVRGGHVLGNAAVSRTEARARAGHGPSGSGAPQQETFGSFLREVGVGLDIRLMSIAGGVVGYYISWSRGTSTETCIITAAIGAIGMLFVDAFLLIFRMRREDQMDLARNPNQKSRPAAVNRKSLKRWTEGEEQPSNPASKQKTD